MATDGLLQIPASSCGIDEEFNVNSLLMSAAEDGWACGNPDGDFLSELLDATNSVGTAYRFVVITQINMLILLFRLF